MSSHILPERVHYSMMLMSLYKLENQPNNQYDVVDPNGNKYDEVAPLYARFQSQAKKNEKSNCDEPSEKCSKIEKKVKAEVEAKFCLFLYCKM